MTHSERALPVPAVGPAELSVGPAVVSVPVPVPGLPAAAEGGSR